MINVVFLLLIFFLMTAQITAPDPVDIQPPGATTTDGHLPDDGISLWLDNQGRLLDADGTPPDLAALGETVILRADATASAADLARVLQQLGQAGARDVTLVARRDGG
jgi:biopolymer transport protein ExbD